MPTIEQIRAARALLGWSQSDLADRASLSQTGIARIENGTNKPNSQTINKIETAFDKADVEFLGNSGVQKRENEIKIFEGQKGFVDFLNDVYETLNEGNVQKQVIANNVSEDDFLKWEGEYAKVHQTRMRDLSVAYKIITKEGDPNFTGAEYAEYRWVSEAWFSSVSYYIYGSHSALIDFSDNSVTVYMIKNKAIANFYREEFEKIWTLAKIPN